MEKKQATTGKGRFRPGRPTIPDNKRKKSRTLTISDAAWEALESLLKDWEIKSVSELVEKIGLEQLGVHPLVAKQSNDLVDISIYQRLKLFIQPPVAVFWSLLAFVKRTSLQLGLKDDEVFLSDVVKRAIAVVFYTGYTHPDKRINNPSAFLRWVSYYILKAEAEHAQVDESTVNEVGITEQQKEECLFKVSSAIQRLNAVSQAPHYRVLKMKSLDQLTVGQIVKILQLQSYHKGEREVMQMVKKGLYQFRQLWETQASEIKQEDESERLGKIRPEVKLYCELATLPNLFDQASHTDLSKLLLTTSSDADLDFWMNEIDHYCGFVLNSDLENYKLQQEKLRQTIDDEIDAYLVEKKIEADQYLASCSDRSDIEAVLDKLVKQEIGAKFPIKTFLGPQLSEFITILKTLEELSEDQTDIRLKLKQYIEALRSEIF